MTDRTLIQTRISNELKVMMDEAMKKLEESQLIEVNQAAFIRQAILYYSQTIKENEIGLVLRKGNGKHK